jgi:hypothetical protein
MTGRYPADRTAAGRSFTGILIVLVTFYSRQINLLFEKTVTTTVTLFIDTIKLSLDKVFNYAATVVFFSSSIILSLGRTLSVERNTILYSQPIKVRFMRILEQIAILFSGVFHFIAVPISITYVVINTGKIFLDLSISIWGFGQTIVTAGVSKVCSTAISLGKFCNTTTILSKYSNLKGGVRK